MREHKTVFLQDEVGRKKMGENGLYRQGYKLISFALLDFLERGNFSLLLPYFMYILFTFQRQP